MPKFVKGKSGNPGGRPAGIGEVRALARAHTQKALQVLRDALDSDREDLRIKAADALLDRGWGKPGQPIEHSGAEGVPLGITVEFVGGKK